MAITIKPAVTPSVAIWRMPTLAARIDSPSTMIVNRP